QANELLTLFWGHPRVQPIRGVTQYQRGHALWVEAVEILRNHAAHGKAGDVRLLDTIRVEQPLQVMGEVEGVEGTVVVVRVAVTAGVPRDDGEVCGESGKLVMPVGTIAANAVHKDKQGAGALLVHCKAGRASYVLGCPGSRCGCGSHAHLRPNQKHCRGY